MEPVLSGAEYLASIFGTEKDKVNCSFYFKIGACRHGDKCSRTHNRPTFSQTLVMKNLYHNPKLDLRRADAGFRVSDAEEQEHFDGFFAEIFTELEDAYGELEEINVCDNIGEHMIGNVYVKFRREEDAQKAETALNDRWFDGRPIYAQLSPVTDFREACCRQYEMGECTRGGFCNFMHLKPISYELRRMLFNREHPWRKAPKIKTKKKRRKRRKRRALSFESDDSLLLSESEESSSIWSGPPNRIADEGSESLPKAYLPVQSYSGDSTSDEDDSKAKQKRPKTDRSPSLPRAFRLDRFSASSDDEMNDSKQRSPCDISDSDSDRESVTSGDSNSSSDTS